MATTMAVPCKKYGYFRVRMERAARLSRWHRLSSQHPMRRPRRFRQGRRVDMHMKANRVAIGLAALLCVSAGTLHAAQALPDTGQTLIDFDKLRPGPVGTLLEVDYTIYDTGGSAKIATSSNPAIPGQVLTSDVLSTNLVTVRFHRNRRTIDIDVTPDPDAEPSIIEFLENSSQVVHTEEVQPGDGTRHLTFTAPGNKKLEAVRWRGGKVTIDNIRQYDPGCARPN